MRIRRFPMSGAGAPDWRWPARGIALGLILMLCSIPPWSAAQNIGISDKTIRIGANMPLEGDNKANGSALKRGIEAALSNQTVQGRRIEFVAVNDFYDPSKSLEAARQLIDQGVFLMLGGYGTPTTKAILPMLAANKVPALGFYTGAAFTGPGDVLNFRASYVDEVKSMVNTALTAGVKATEVCAYVQNDLYGMSGVKGLQEALSAQPDTAPIVAKLGQILDMSGAEPERNNIGPVGVYSRETVTARAGYQSLKKWEETGGNRCRFIVVAAIDDPSAAFMAYARYKGEKWVFGTLSVLTAGKMKNLLKEQKITDKVIATQVVPTPDSALPVAMEARKALGPDLDTIAMEGYIVGKLFLAVASASETPLTREGFLKAARRQSYDIGGIKVDFTGGHQGSNFVALTFLKDGEFIPAKPVDIESLFKQ